MSDLAPLVPAEVDLRGLPWMPVDTVRLLDSDLWALSTGEELKAALKLWCKAWQQVPAASLPDDDRILASLSGSGRMWSKLRPMALRGFVRCTDGRLYHPVIAEKAMEAWEHRRAQRDKANKRWHPSGTPAAHATASPTAMQGTGTETGRGKGQDLKPTTATSSAASGGAGKTVATWQGYAAAYRERWGVEPTRNRTVNGQLARFLERVPTEEAPQIAAFFVRSNRGLYVSAKHPVNLLLRDAEALRTEWLTGQQGTDRAARQADETATRGGAVHSLLEEKRKVAGA